jgi:hypothetical protein
MRERLPLVISITALVIAVLGTTPLGEAAYNAIVPPNSVGAIQLRNAAVTNAKLRGDAVTSGKVKNRSLKAIDFAPGQLPAGPPGPKGDKGDKGTKGDKGDKGATGITAYEIVRKSVSVPANSLGHVQVQCPTGKQVIGGAANVQLLPAGVLVFTNLTGTDNWDAFARNTTAAPQQLNGVAICATVAP